MCANVAPILYHMDEPKPEGSKILSFRDKWLSIQFSKFYTAYLEEDMDTMSKIKEEIETYMLTEFGAHFRTNIVYANGTIPFFFPEKFKKPLLSEN